MSAPPPMPNRPARIPVMNPPTMIKAASSSSSLTGTPRIMSCSGGTEAATAVERAFRNVENKSRGGGVRHSRVDVHHEGERGTESVSVRAGLHAFGGQMAAEGARARDAAEQAEDVPRDGMQPRTAGKL